MADEDQAAAEGQEIFTERKVDFGCLQEFCTYSVRWSAITRATSTFRLPHGDDDCEPLKFEMTHGAVRCTTLLYTKYCV